MVANKKNRYSSVLRRAREKKRLKLKAYSSPEWYEVAKQLHHECSKQDIPIDKNLKQNKAKFSFLKKK